VVLLKVGNEPVRNNENELNGEKPLLLPPLFVLVDDDDEYEDTFLPPPTQPPHRHDHDEDRRRSGGDCGSVSSCFWVVSRGCAFSTRSRSKNATLVKRVTIINKKYTA
jgi:hypothetical protein